MFLRHAAAARPYVRLCAVCWLEHMALAAKARALDQLLASAGEPECLGLGSEFVVLHPVSHRTGDDVPLMEHACLRIVLGCEFVFVVLRAVPHRWR